MSAVLCVKLVPPHNSHAQAVEEFRGVLASSGLVTETTYILKLFDRRCGDVLRSEVYASDAEVELEYQRWLARPNRTSVAHGRRVPDWERDGFTEEEHMAIVEDWIQSCCRKTCETEIAIYRRLTRDSADSRLFPHFFGSLVAQTDIGPVPGFLMEYVAPALTLTQFLSHAAPCDYLAQTVEDVREDALKTLAMLNDAYILNTDIRPDNVLVRLSKRELGMESQQHL